MKKTFDKRTFDVFLLPEILQELRKRGILTVAKIYTDEVDGQRVRSRFGYEGDTWYIPEHGRFTDERESIIIFEDQTARKKSGGMGIDIVPPMFFDEAPIKVNASKMPKWAARTWAEITHVGYPKRVQELTDSEIQAMGFSHAGDNIWQIGDTRMSSGMTLKDLFSIWWNDNMGGWRVINKSGLPYKALCYPFAEGMQVRAYDTQGLPQQVIINPYVITYTLKLI